MSSSGNFPDAKVIALMAAVCNRVPFYSGACTIPDHQRTLYYTHDDHLHRVDFSNAGVDDLGTLYRACKPAEFGRNGENVLDESYRKAGKMDLTSFATLFDPRDLGIHEQVSKALLTRSHCTVDVELHKLNVYGKGDFFKAHKDTPRGHNMFGSLVVVLPTPHEGGQLVLRHGKEWTLDFSDKFSTATEPSVCFVAFFGDIEHEVLPVTSGYRVTLTYNLYDKPVHPSVSLIPTPSHLQLKKAFVDLLNDESKLPDGGYLGFGLAHEYVHTGRDLLNQVLDQLKGSDRAVVDMCHELGLSYSLRFLYRDIDYSGLNLITTGELDIRDPAMYLDGSFDDYLREALEEFSIEVKSIIFVGQQNRKPIFLEDGYDEYYGPLLRTLYKDSITVLEITPMQSSLDTTTSYISYGNEVGVGHLYGTACMLIAVNPAGLRDHVAL